MIFPFERICSVADTFTYHKNSSFSFGRPGALTVLAVLEGAYQLDEDEPRVAETGCLVIGNASIWLAPVGPSRIGGVSLTGVAPDEFAAGCEGIQVVGRNASGGAEEQIIRLVEGSGAMAPSEMSAQAYALLCRLAAASQCGPLPPLVAAAVGEMREHYAEVYGVEELADRLEVSKGHLIRTFSASMGISPGRYLTAIRVENAKRLLLQDNYTLDMIAGLCGFSDANYLCKVFKNRTGETPAAWRRRTAPFKPRVSPEEWDSKIFL